jgi:hypothetical protein
MQFLDSMGSVIFERISEMAVGGDVGVGTRRSFEERIWGKAFF